MTPEWLVVPLSDLTTVPATYGVVQPGPNLASGLPMLRVNNFQNDSLNLADVMRIAPEIEAKYERTRLEDGDVLITIVGSVGQVAVVPKELKGWNIARAVAMIRPKEPELSRWIAFALRSQDVQHQLGVAANTTVQTTINLKDLRALQIPLPDKSTRAEISEILGALDDRIGILRQTNATLEAIAATLFESWFVDFDGIAQQDMEESELGLIPNGWRVGTLADLCELNASKWTDKKHPPTVRYIDLSAVSSNRIEAIHEHSFDEAPSRARLQLREGDTIVGTVRPGNRAFAYIHAPQANLTGSTGFAVLSPKQAHYASFVYLAATQDQAIKRLANLADGAAYPAVRPNVVAETPCVIAPDEVIAEFSSTTKPLLERIEQNSQQAATLATLRDTLLPRLISGKLRIGDAARMAEHAI